MGSQRPLFASYITHTPYSPFPCNGTTNNHWQLCDQKKLVIWLNIVWASNSTLDALALGKRTAKGGLFLSQIILCTLGVFPDLWRVFFPIFSPFGGHLRGVFALGPERPWWCWEGGGIPFSRPKLVGLTKIHLAQPSCRGLLCQLQRTERECVREQGVMMLIWWWW